MTELILGQQGYTEKHFLEKVRQGRWEGGSVEGRGGREGGDTTASWSCSAQSIPYMSTVLTLRKLTSRIT